MMNDSYDELKKKEKIISYTLLALIVAVVVAATFLAFLLISEL